MGKKTILENLEAKNLSENIDNQANIQAKESPSRVI